MQIRGSIKGVKASLTADSDVTQVLTIEFTDSAALQDLRELMQQPVIVTIEETQARFGAIVGATNGTEK